VVKQQPEVVMLFRDAVVAAEVVVAAVVEVVVAAVVEVVVAAVVEVVAAAVAFAVAVAVAVAVAFAVVVAAAAGGSCMHLFLASTLEDPLVLLLVALGSCQHGSELVQASKAQLSLDAFVLLLGFQLLLIERQHQACLGSAPAEIYKPLVPGLMPLPFLVEIAD